MLILTQPLLADNKGYIQKIKKIIMIKYEDIYPSIDIKEISIKSLSTKKLNGFELNSVKFKNDFYKKRSGSLVAIFKKNKRSIKIPLRYKIEAYIKAYVAKRRLTRGMELKEEDFERKIVEFDHFYYKPIKKIENLVLRQNIRPGKILCENMIKKKPDIEKNSYIKAILKDGGLEIMVDAKALQDGRIGDIIKIRNSNGKVFMAKVISSDSVLIK